MRLPVFLLLCLCLLFSGCSTDSGAVFTWQTRSRPDNLDPQLAVDDGDVTAVRHLYSGLFRLDAQGTPQADCCARYTRSADGLCYRFWLKSGLHWLALRGAECEQPLTADDFSFALYRVRLPQTASPYAELFSGIVSACAVSNEVLEIRLARPDPDFLVKLCCPGALPCCRAFFEASAGRYGLDGPHTRGNGPFYMTNWTDSGLFLARDDPPRGGVERLRLVTGPDGVSAGLCSAAPGQEDSFSLTTWCLVPNPNAAPFSQPELRQALAALTAQSAFPVPAGLMRTGRILPASLRSGRPLAAPTWGAPLPLYQQALQALEVRSLHNITIFLPDDIPDDVAAALDRLHQRWQRALGLYCRVQRLPAAELYALRESGGYQLMLLPLRATSPDPKQTMFDWCGCTDEEAALREALLIVLFSQPQRFWSQPAYTGLVYDSFANVPDVTRAQAQKSRPAPVESPEKGGF